MGIVVRTATLADLDAIRFVGFSTWPPTYGPFAGPSYVVEHLDQWWSVEALTAPVRDGEALIAVDGDNVVGISQIANYGDDLVMWKLYVMPDQQGRGTGRGVCCTNW